MGNLDLLVIINDWFLRIIPGQNYENDWDAVFVALGMYRDYERSIPEHDRDHDFDWSIRTIRVYEASVATINGPNRKDEQ